MGRAIPYALSVVKLLVAGMRVLNELGVSIAPILGAAGVVGVAIGFGAQSLIKDYFTGYFLLVENQIRGGDVVEIAGRSGLVEAVSLRKVMLRDDDGSVHSVANGLITAVTHRSTAFSFAGIDIGIDYRCNIGRALDVMRRVAADLRADPAYAQHCSLKQVRLPRAGVPPIAWLERHSVPACAGTTCGVVRTVLRLCHPHPRGHRDRRCGEPRRLGRHPAQPHPHPAAGAMGRAPRIF